MEQQHLVRGREPSSRGRVAAGRDHDAPLSVPVGDAGDDLLNGAIPDGLRVFLALDDDAQSRLIGDDIHALIAAGLRDASIPFPLAPKLRPSPPAVQNEGRNPSASPDQRAACVDGVNRTSSSRRSAGTGAPRRLSPIEGKTPQSRKWSRLGLAPIVQRGEGMRFRRRYHNQLDVDHRSAPRATKGEKLEMWR